MSLPYIPEFLVEIDVLNYDEVNDDMRVTSISGPGDERIEILADAIGQFNTTGTGKILPNQELCQHYI